VDVRLKIVETYKRVFWELEATGVLDSESERDIWCLHKVFLPRLNKHLEEFAGDWAYHKMSNNRGKSVLKMWIDGQMLKPIGTLPLPVVLDEETIDGSVDARELKEPVDEEDDYEVNSAVRYLPPIDNNSMDWLLKTLLPQYRNVSFGDERELSRLKEGYAALRNALIVLIGEQLAALY
jgi:hypothetical protein